MSSFIMFFSVFYSWVLGSKLFSLFLKITNRWTNRKHNRLLSQQQRECQVWRWWWWRTTIQRTILWPGQGSHWFYPQSLWYRFPKTQGTLSGINLYLNPGSVHRCLLQAGIINTLGLPSCRNHIHLSNIAVTRWREHIALVSKELHWFSVSFWEQTEVPALTSDLL